MHPRVHTRRRATRAQLLAACLLAALSLSACSKGGAVSWDDPGPVQTFERFLLDWYRGAEPLSWQAIAPEDREALLKKREALKREAKLPDDAVAPPHELFIGTSVDSPYEFRKIEVVEPLKEAPKPGHRVTLKLAYLDGREGQARMVWGGDRWYVDLPLERVADTPTSPDTTPQPPAKTPAPEAPQPPTTGSSTAAP